MGQVETYLAEREHSRGKRGFITAIIGFPLGIIAAYVQLEATPRQSNIAPDAGIAAEDMGLIPLGIIYGLVCWALLAVLSLILDYPYFIADSRRVPARDAIRICAWFGLLLFPLWIIALIWAVAATPSATTATIPATPSPPLPEPETLGSLETREYLVLGVSRTTERDIRWRIQAASPANAKVKAELRGAVVTEVVDAPQVGGDAP